jgi:hypothetical protein
MQSKTLNKILKSHPLAPLMVLTALEQFSKEVAASEPSQYPERGLIAPDCWIDLAKQIQQQLNGGTK